LFIIIFSYVYTLCTYTINFKFNFLTTYRSRIVSGILKKFSYRRIGIVSYRYRGFIESNHQVTNFYISNKSSQGTELRPWPLVEDLVPVNKRKLQPSEEHEMVILMAGYGNKTYNRDNTCNDQCNVIWL